MRPCKINRMQVGAGAPVRLMGVLNASPESFFPASYVPPHLMHSRATAMIEQGADILDVGARATGPGAPPLTIREESERIAAALQDLSGVGTLSVDTLHPEVLEVAMKYDIHAVNDISGLLDPRMRQLIADGGLPAILMAARERPGDAGSVDAVQSALKQVTERCTEAGVGEYILDPGIGLWTSERTMEDNWELCRHFSEFNLLERPLLAAISRKSFLGGLIDRPVRERMAASLALNMLLLSRGAAMVRVHDVRETADAIRVFEKIEGRR